VGRETLQKKTAGGILLKLQNRKLLDKSTTIINYASIFFMTVALVILLAPIVVRGLGAYIFRGTIEHRKVIFEQFQRGRPEILQNELDQVQMARQPVFDMLKSFETELDEMEGRESREMNNQLKELKGLLRELYGVLPGERDPILLRKQYGKTRWKDAREVFHQIMQAEKWDYSDPQHSRLVRFPRRDVFQGTSLEPLFDYLPLKFRETMRPRLVFYLHFLLDESKDAHFFGGIFPEILGTVYLTLFAILFAVPFGVIAAVYLAEFAGDTRFVSLLRSFINTLAGVPSIVFGLFGLAFFINTVKLSETKSVLVGGATLALLVLPTIIRASEEAILAVPREYKEASLSMGASQLRTIVSVILPAALPGILTGIIISMGRAAGETAPIIFTAAVSVGKPLKLLETFSQPTPALPWNIYNLCTEHEAVDSIRHVQFGMVFTLIAVVLTLNITAIFLRARILKKLRG